MLYSAATIIVGLLVLILGLSFMTMGYRLFKPVCFLAGFYVGVILGYVILANVEPDTGFNNREAILLGVCIVLGLLVGGLAMCLSSVGIWLIGGVAGFFFAMFILSWKDNGAIESVGGRGGFIAICCGIGALLAFFFEKIIVMAGTALTGSFT
jgi:hypothetical protein